MIVSDNIKYQTFNDIDLEDTFFDSLKDDYPEFEEWFYSHPDRCAHVYYNDNKIQGFLHIKDEHGIVDDVFPNLIANNILKVATFKVDAHKTKLGERFIKIITDHAIETDADLCYVTIYEKHKSLILLLERYGFTYSSQKNNEKVYVKRMHSLVGDIEKDFPIMNGKGNHKYLLGVYPRYHSLMFPDSILNTEDKKIITDVSYTNSIHKIYVCSMGIEVLKKGDLIVIYRTAEPGQSAEYKSVATSVCTVEEIKRQDDFSSFDEFYEYASQYSVFDKGDLYKWYVKGNCKCLKMTYNAAFKKRIVRHDLISRIGLSRDAYWGFLPLNDTEFRNIMLLGKVNANLLYD